MKPGISVIALLAGSSVLSCGFQRVDIHYEVNFEHLPNVWYHVYEKDCGVEKVYMPYGEDFMTTWRVRNRLELRTDGTASYVIATPDDPHLLDPNPWIEGWWDFSPDDNVLRIMDQHGQTAFAFRVRHVSPTTLRLVNLDLARPDEDG